MRILTILLTFAGLGSAFVLLDRLTAPAGAGGTGPTSAAAIQMARALADRAGLSVDGMVVAPARDGERDFRGLVSAEGRLRPVYGRVRVICAGDGAGPECWEISYLEIDGRDVAHRVVPARATTETPDEKPDDDIETADTRPLQPPLNDVTPILPAAAIKPDIDRAAPDTDAGPDDDAPSGATATDGTLIEGVATGKVPVPAARPAAGRTGPLPNAADDARAPTHRVDRDWINAREGPGTDAGIVARLPSGVRLALIESRDDWGRFVVLDGAVSGHSVWASLTILQAVP